MYQLFDPSDFFSNIFPHLDLQSTSLVLNVRGELTNSTWCLKLAVFVALNMGIQPAPNTNKSVITEAGQRASIFNKIALEKLQRKEGERLEEKQNIIFVFL